MMPNMDPRALKKMMDSMGMKTTEIDAERVIIECRDRRIVVDSPGVTMIEMQGNKTFQVGGIVSETAKEKAKVEITDDDVQMVRERTGASEDAARKALEETEGDIAEAIMKLKG
ncbi:MAG TPA: nascent polypeptide-associated complex protein [Candidatus Saccharimonadales bacterium]|nr:nascent polypeptide-associated complex protein [Candidatus Saccharimonadales bacterium]